MDYLAAFRDMPPSLLLVPLLALCVPVAKHLLAKWLEPPFEQRSLLNKSETRLFRDIRAVLPEGYSVHPQVSYGEFLGCPSRSKFMRINAKRADMVICDQDMSVVAVVEYQGSGHFGSTRAARENTLKRDGQKRAALKEAGLPMIEIPAKFSRDSVAQAVHTAVTPPSHQPMPAPST